MTDEPAIGQPRITIATRLVLRELLSAGKEGTYGREIVRATELKSGTVHPVLVKLARAGWLTSSREDIDPHEEGRPPRMYYRLTEEGAEQAKAALRRPVRGASALRQMLSESGPDATTEGA